LRSAEAPSRAAKYDGAIAESHAGKSPLRHQEIQQVAWLQNAACFFCAFSDVSLLCHFQSGICAIARTRWSSSS